MLEERGDLARERLAELDRALLNRGSDLALFLSFDRPERVEERPDLARLYFAQRCVTDEQLEQIGAVFREIGAYVELFAGERPLLEALANGRLQSIERSLKLIYNGIEGGVTPGGFEPGRKALLPAIADSYGLICCNSNAYACALGRHKFHYLTVIRSLGIRTPRAWHYRPETGWAGGMAPANGTKVIVKSTYESWSVGVSDDSVFVVDDSCEGRVSTVAHQIGQAVTVQEFVSGPEVFVPILSCPEPVVMPPMEAVLDKDQSAPDAVVTIDDNLRRRVSHRRFEDDPGVMASLCAAAVHVFDALGLRSLARIDFRVDDAGEPWVIDVGVSPGLGAGGAACRSIGELGFDYPGFLRVVIAATLASRGETDFEGPPRFSHSEAAASGSFEGEM
jgi:D-alanine-D-alanine ligase